MRTPFKTHVRSWITGLHSRIFWVPPAGECEAGVLAYYNEDLEEIGDAHACWRLHGERDDAFRHRLAVHVQEKILQLEATLDRLLKKPRREE